MSAIQPPEGLSLADFEAIEAAVTETVRGRWFLAEFARRTRARETEKVLAALARLEQAVVSDRPQIAREPDPQIVAALASIGERLNDIAWILRDRGIEAGVCGAIEAEARILARLQQYTGLPRELADQTRPPQPAAAAAPEARPSGLAERIEPMRPPAPMPAAEPQISASAAPLPLPGRGPREPALSDLDAMPLREKLRFFA
jgi:hypothetical protein